MRIKKQFGFSLIEALVVVAVLSIVGVIMVDLLSRTLKGGAKTQLIGTIKDNGQTAITIMENAIRQADAAVCPAGPAGVGDKLYDQATNYGQNALASPLLPSVLVVSSNGQFTRFGFIYPANQPAYLAKDNPVVPDPNDPTQVIQLCEHSPGTAVIGNGGVAGPTPSVTTLTDSSSITVVPETNPSSPTRNIFLKSHNPGYKDIITIQFDLAPAAASAKAEGQVGTDNTVHFNDSIELR